MKFEGVGGRQAWYRGLRPQRRNDGRRRGRGPARPPSPHAAGRGSRAPQPRPPTPWPEVAGGAPARSGFPGRLGRGPHRIRFLCFLTDSFAGRSDWGRGRGDQKRSGATGKTADRAFLTPLLEERLRSPYLQCASCL